MPGEDDFFKFFVPIIIKSEYKWSSCLYIHQVILLSYYENI